MDKLLNYLLLIIFAVSFAACGNDEKDEPNNPDKPDVETPDLVGTVQLTMRNGDKTSLDGLFIGADDNFHGSKWMLTDLGEMYGIGNIKTIPLYGWASKVSVLPKHGYIACHETGVGASVTYEFYRIFVDDYIYEAVSQGVIGAQIKYQQHFNGLDEDIQIETDNFQFSGEGDTKTIIFENNSLINFDIQVSQPWCTVNKITTLQQPFLYNGIEISVPKMNSKPQDCIVTIKTVYNKERQIKVQYMGFEPYLRIENVDEFSDIPWEGKIYNIPLQTNCLETLDFSRPEWIEVLEVSDNFVTVSVKQNDLREYRECEFFAHSSLGIESDRLKIVQNWHKYIVDAFNVTSKTFDANPGTGNHHQFRFNTSYHPGEIVCETDYGNQEPWFTVRFRWNGANGNTDGWVDVENVGLNNTGVQRTATITLKSTDGENSLVYTIIQKS